MNPLKPALLLFACIVFGKLPAQVMILDTMETRYYQSNTEPPDDWKLIEFNDSSWVNSVGVHAYTYGETYFQFQNSYFFSELDTNTTTYFRYNFKINNVLSYSELVLICDFDDGFVASINGVEFARVNMGKQMSSTTFDQLADRSHDMEILADKAYPVLGHYIDKDFIKNNFISGKNVLTIEVHNDAVDGSDLGNFAMLFDITNSGYNLWSNVYRYKKCVQLDSTKLPIVVVETDEYGIPYKRIDVDGTIGIIHNNQGKYNKPEDGFNHLFSPITIEQRGESSADFPKKSFDFELHDTDGNDTSISVLGMPREADWILQGPFADKSQIRNALFYELARKTGHWTPRVEFCELVLNGQYMGLYNLIEKIKRDSNRVNIAKLRPEEIEGTDLTGGYILKYDKGASGVQIVYPKAGNLQQEQEQYIRDYISQYESVLFSNQGLEPNSGYKQYIDETSLIDYVIVAELGKNCDSYLYSSYFYKDKDDRDCRLKYGPIWDFDLCMGNASWQNGDKINQWQFEYPQNKNFHIKRLFQDTELVQAFNDRWFELRKTFLHKDSLFNRIDELRTELADAIERNYEVWPVIDKSLFFPAYNVNNYDAEITHLKSWLSDRLNWMDNNIGSIFYPITQYTGVENVAGNATRAFDVNVYPNPVHNEMYIDLDITNAGKMQIEFIDIQGRVVNVIEPTYVEPGNYKVYWNRNEQSIKPGLHIVSISIDGKQQGQVKVIME